MTPQLNTVIQPIFPSSDYETCKLNVSNARIFMVMTKDKSVKEKFYEGFREHLDLGSLQQDENLTEDVRKETTRYAENLLKIFVEKLWNTELSVDQICGWVSGVYSSEEKMPYFYAKNEDTGVEMIVTRIDDGSGSSSGDASGAQEQYDPHSEL
eukprot:CAMPEP_0117445136 /NCGR_PEP_ID=MMETSP0759-20121206/5628_1 /TAXON_ID=63605 /ORGANISM="Percolomonas cosmopolitus, Strain WS" /LENGTH=153 /DNA_ID=CAMNT_0005237279 /DNA_START=166 /DNA_END=627 /DNA_ORIENTATION=-